MSRTTALVTGAYGAIGKAIALGLAKQGNCEVVLVGRNASNLEQATDEVRTVTGNSSVRHEVVDLSRRAEIDSLAERWSGPLHVLINNAAACPRRRSMTPEGLEVQFATNIMGYVWMMLAFESLLEQSSPSRVVNVASYWAGDLDIDDLQFERRPYDNDTAYRQSKQANRMLTVAFAQRWRGTRIAVNACHPGDVNSKLSNDLGFGGSESPEAGARTPVWLATDSALEGVTGEYFQHLRGSQCQFGADERAVEALYRLCLSQGATVNR